MIFDYYMYSIQYVNANKLSFISHLGITAPPTAPEILLCIVSYLPPYNSPMIMSFRPTEDATDRVSGI